MKKWLVCLFVAVIAGGGAAHAAKEKNIIKFGRDVTIEEGRIVRGAAAVVGNITILGTAEDDVVAVGGSVHLGPRAVVGGNVVSVGGIIEKHKKASVNGNIVEANIPGLSTFSKKTTPARKHRIYWLFKATTFLGFLTLGMLTVMILPKPILMVSERIEQRTIDAISWSIRGLVLIVPLAVVLTMSVAGILLIPLEVILVAGAALFGYFAMAQLIGKKIRELYKGNSRQLYIETLIGITVIGIVGMIPVAGWIVKAIIALIGLGGVLGVLFGAVKNRIRL